MGTFDWTSAARESWDKMAHRWHSGSVEMWMHGSRKDILPLFKQYIPKGKVADLGCGDGYGSWLLFHEGYQVTGMDLSREMILLAKQMEDEGLSFEEGDMNNLPFKDNEFDAVMAINSLEWTEHPLTALQEISRIVGNGGHACIGILGPTAGPRENSFERLKGKQVFCNTMMPWEFERLASELGWNKLDEKAVFKKGVPEALGSNLSNELRQALTFMTLFIFKIGHA
ncbi:MAG TPA: class I SAM-dependent methyltransferase [Bacillaceae bacterium]